MTDPMRRGLQIVAKIVEVMETLVDEKTEDAASEDHSTDWLAWAVPAIQEALADHIPRRSVATGRIYCEHGGMIADEDYQDQQEWREHVAPLIAQRIGCDPPRAIQALQSYRPDKVRP